MENVRNKNIDIVKSLAIMMVVLGHCGFPLRGIFSLFHVPIFFMASGYCYNSNHSKSIKDILKLVKKRVKQLYVPFILINIMLILFHNFFIKINFYTNNNLFLTLSTGNSYGLSDFYGISDIIKNIVYVLLFRNEEQLAGATWFLRVIFLINIAYAINSYLIDKILKNKKGKNIVHFIISVIFLMFGYYCSKHVRLLSWNLSTFFSSYILFELGYLISNINIKYKHISLIYVICLISFLLLSFISKINFVSLNINEYSNPISLICISLLGFIFTYSIAILIIRYSKKVVDLIVDIGKNTIYILFLHFIAFKLITYIQLRIYNLPNYSLASFPTLYINNGWWILYFLAGIIIPMIICKTLKYCKERVHEKYSNNK